MIKRGTCMLVTGLLASLVLAGCAGPTSGTISTLQMEDEVILDTDSVVPSTKASSAAVSAEEATEEAGQKEESTESVISESTSSDTQSTISENTETISSESAPEITETPAPTPEVTETPTPTPTPTATPTPTPEPTPTPDPDEGMLVIGSRAEDSSWRVPVKNEVFSDIVYLSIKNADDPEYPGNFLPEGQRLKDQSEGILYFTYKDPTAYYNVKVQFDDGSYHYMTAVPFADMENARILYEDKILFMIYESKETGEELSTKDTELDWIIAKLGTE